MVKRILDLGLSLTGLFFLTPIIMVAAFLVWVQDFKSPLYVSERIGKDGVPFKMVKIRSMVFQAEAVGIDSTSANDARITKVGRFIRKFKIDELGQLINVVNGSMSVVGPRPNVRTEVNLYTHQEKRLLEVKPGITDIASVVFADEAEILSGSKDPDISYNQLIRPWKSRMGLVYVQEKSLKLDLSLIIVTMVSLFSRELALKRIVKLLQNFEVDDAVIRVASRQNKLTPYPPPGSNQIVTSREVQDL